MNSLTKRQAELLEYIQNHIKAKRVAPTFREMMIGLGLSSPGSVYKLVKSLRTKGLLSTNPKKWRSLALKNSSPLAPSESPNFLSIPLIGTLAKGMRIDLYAKEQVIHLPATFLQETKTVYALLIRDESFASERLCKNDIVIIESTYFPKDGEIVLVTLNEKGALLGKFFKEKNGSRLEAFYQLGSSHYNKVIASFKNDSAQVLGTLIGLFRSYSKKTMGH
jgi:repressor LexA